MQYKYELHAHTCDISRCAISDAQKLVLDYTNAHYDAVVLTNHMSRFTYEDRPKMDWKSMVDIYMEGYYNTKKVAGDRLNILLGMEVCFDESCSDYLIYGMTENFLYEHGNVLKMGIEKFSPLARENGMLVFQAHPFRNQMTMTRPSLLDGIEVLNRNPRHDSRNDIAKIWAEKFNLLESAGSDYHQDGDAALSGILTQKRIVTNADLLDTLKSKKFSII